VTQDERELVRRSQNGDAEAFALLVNEHQQFAYNLALRALGNTHEAEDAAQDAFVRAWMALPNFRGQSQFRTWLYRIVTNVCYNRMPRLRREMSAMGDEQVLDVPDETSEGPTAGIEADERRAYLHRQIDSLPESYKILVTLRYQQELSYDEIASVLSLPLGTVKTGLFRAKAQLRQALRQFEEPVYE
jgi:RNA polymerase sigma-70 factor (ECF subfamily)